MPVYKVASGLRLRSEYFGGLAWWPNGFVKKLEHPHMQILYALGQPRDFTELSQFVDEDTMATHWHDLLSHRLIVESVVSPVSIVESDLVMIRNRIFTAMNRTVMRPFWVHLQPFVFCNQNCIHCYCDAGSNKKPFMAESLPAWKIVVDKLVEFGVWDIYVTGGENLIVDECLILIDYIKSKGISVAISTNGMLIKDRVLTQLKKINLPLIQVSLDGATAETNDFIRGKCGAFEKTVNGIRKLSEITKVAINCVINKKNWHEVEDMVILGKTLGVLNFKFFPQKLAGRSQKKHILADQEIFELEKKCLVLSKQYEVYIESIDLKKPCGSGISGFAINENFGIVPCIFSTHNSNQVFGNALRDDFEEVWFDSRFFRQFRSLRAAQPCHRCEIIL